MTPKINPRNLTAQLHYRALGNPESSLPRTAISNCFPGLETDFRNFWRRAFVGIVLLECNNYVTETAKEYQHLLHHRLLKIDGQSCKRMEDQDIVTTVKGPQAPGDEPLDLTKGPNPQGVAAMEWSNALAFVLQRQGEKVKCYFTLEKSEQEQAIPADATQMLEVELTVRRMFEVESATIAAGVLKPGELTQGLCSPWQNDYRECACYYWAASRPDYVNVEPTPDGVSRGDNWMSKGERTGEYLLDDRSDSRLVQYDDLFKDWESMLHFQIKGRDAEES